MRVVSEGARRHLFFPRVNLRSTNCTPVVRPTPTHWACLHSPGGCHHSLDPVYIVGTTNQWNIHGKKQPTQREISVENPLFSDFLQALFIANKLFVNHPSSCSYACPLCLLGLLAMHTWRSGSYTGHIQEVAVTHTGHICVRSWQLFGGRILTTCWASSGHKPGVRLTMVLLKVVLQVFHAIVKGIAWYC